MDANKLKKMGDVELELKEVCGLCEHGRFASGDDFGTCTLHTYEHLKHKGGDKISTRQLSTHKGGGCVNWQPSPVVVLMRQSGWTTSEQEGRRT